MIKQHFNKALFLLLSAALLVFTWTPLHAHLNVQHDHGGEQHQHNTKAHAHQVFHADQIDSTHLQNDEAQVVGLDHDKSPANGKQLDIQPAIMADFAYCQPLLQTREFGLPDGCNYLPRPHLHQLGQPRAPPQLS